MRKLLLTYLCAALLFTGCAAPALRPVQARERLLANPQVSDWYYRHSAPAVLQSLVPADAKRWRKYHPALMFDRVDEGYLVRLEARFGPEPRSLTVLMDAGTGTIRTIKAK